MVEVHNSDARRTPIGSEFPRGKRRAGEAPTAFVPPQIITKGTRITLDTQSGFSTGVAPDLLASGDRAREMNHFLMAPITPGTGHNSAGVQGAGEDGVGAAGTDSYSQHDVLGSDVPNLNTDASIAKPRKHGIARRNAMALAAGLLTAEAALVFVAPAIAKAAPQTTLTEHACNSGFPDGTEVDICVDFTFGGKRLNQTLYADEHVGLVRAGGGILGTSTITGQMELEGSIAGTTDVWSWKSPVERFSSGQISPDWRDGDRVTVGYIGKPGSMDSAKFFEYENRRWVQRGPTVSVQVP